MTSHVWIWLKQHIKLCTCCNSKIHTLYIHVHTRNEWSCKSVCSSAIIGCEITYGRLKPQLMVYIHTPSCPVLMSHLLAWHAHTQWSSWPDIIVLLPAEGFSHHLCLIDRLSSNSVPEYCMEMGQSCCENHIAYQDTRLRENVSIIRTLSSECPEESCSAKYTHRISVRGISKAAAMM